MAFILSSIASVGVLLFVGTVWYITSTADYIFFVWHPTLMALMILSLTQGVILLQKTATREEKEKGLEWHKWFQILGFISVAAGFGIIFYNKIIHDKEHFTSPHGKFGVTTFSLIAVQTIAGLSFVYFPGLFGGVTQAKGMYKYHRMSGYFILLLIYLTALGGTQASWTKEHFDHVWVWLLATSLVFVGIVGRVKASKMKVR